MLKLLPLKSAFYDMIQFQETVAPQNVSAQSGRLQPYSTEQLCFDCEAILWQIFQMSLQKIVVGLVSVGRFEVNVCFLFWNTD